MAVNDIVQQNINYEVFVDGNRYLGTATVDLPDVQYITEEIAGAGIAGKIDVPTLSHIENFEVTLHWRSIFERPIYLLSQTSFMLSLRAAMQQYDAATGGLKVLSVRIELRALAVEANLGTLEPASNTETESKFHPDYIKILVDNQTLFEHDKFNFVHVANGNDFSAQVRAALGI